MKDFIVMIVKFFCFTFVVDSLVGVEGMVGLEQHCNIPPCPHHYLFHTPRVLSNKTTHIVHLLFIIQTVKGRNDM